MATTKLNPYGNLSEEVNQALDELQNQEKAQLVPTVPAEELFRLEDSVQIFFIQSNGKVSTFSEPATLRIFRFQEQQQQQVNNDDGWAPVFIQVGGWTHPLLPGASPALEAANGAFMFPDVYADDSGSSIGLVLIDGMDHLEEKREQLRKILDEHTALKSDTLLPSDEQLGSIGRALVKSAELMAKGMEKGATKACTLIEYVGERQKEKMPAAETDTKVSPAIKYSVTGAKYATHATVKVSGFVATRVGNLTKRLSNYLATKIERPVTGAVVSTNGGSGAGGVTQSSSMRSIIDAARGGLVAYGTVYTGLEESAKVLGACMKEQSVGVVQHAYGQEAGGVACNAASAAGNAAMTYMNVQSLGVKGLVKRTAKDTAKGVGKKVLDAHAQEKKPKMDETVSK